MMHLSEIARLSAAESYRASFHKRGRKFTADLAKGSLQAAAAALIAMEGEAAAYYAVQAIADEIARQMIDGNADK